MAAPMLWLLFAGCPWGEDSKPTPPPPPDLPPPEASGSALPSPPRMGVAEVETPPEVLRVSEVVDQAAPALVDVWFDPDLTTFDALGEQLDRWGFERVDGDGTTWRVRATGVPAAEQRLARAPGVARARGALTRQVLPSGNFREGSDRVGSLTRSWAWPDGAPPRVTVAGGLPPPDPVLPRELPPAGLGCLAPAVEELEMGVSVGPGWERAMTTSPASWVLVVDHYGSCDASGWVVLRADAAVDHLRFGDRPAAQADETLFHELAITFLGTRRPALDPQAEAAVGLLAASPDAVLARAVRDATPGPAQAELHARFARRDPEAALAVAGASASPVLLSQAAGQDEELRQRLLRASDSSWTALEGAVAVWRPGPSDPPGLLDRFLQSPDPLVRERAWAARIQVEAGACEARPVRGLDAAGLVSLYDACPQPAVRGRVLELLRAADPAAARAALERTLSAPETRETGIAAVEGAASDWALLEAMVANRNVDREVRRVALERLVRAGRPSAGALVEAHGAFLAWKPRDRGTGGVAGP